MRVETIKLQFFFLRIMLWSTVSKAFLRSRKSTLLIRKRERQKNYNNRFNKQNNNFARASLFFVHFLAVFAQLYDVNFINFAFYGERRQAKRDFISLSELGNGLLEFKFRNIRLRLTK